MTDEVFVSVILPVRNEEAFIARSLGAVLNQDYPASRVEILVADGESEDRTLQTIASLPGSERVRVIANPRRTQAAGLNEAICAARGDIIVRVDGHTIIAPDYVRQCVLALKETGADNVGGPMNPVSETPMGKAIAEATKEPFAVPTAFHVSSKAQYTDTVYLGAWPRQVFDRVGTFDERLPPNEDYELNYRIRLAGGKIYLTPQISSLYFGRQTFRALIRQYFHYGKAKVRTLRKHRASLRPRQLVAPLFVAALIAGGALSLVNSIVGILWLSMLIAYLAINIAFSIKVATRAGFTLFWRVPVIFTTIHLAWGVGFWAGLFAGKAEPPRAKTSSSQLSVADEV